MKSITSHGFELTFADASEIYAMDVEGEERRSGLRLVDFVVETDERYLFVSVLGDRRASGEPTRGGALCESLARAFRDSVFFHIFGEWQPKRLEFVVLCPEGGVDGALVFALQDELRRRVPISHPSWSVDSAAGVSMMNEAMWLRRFGDGSLRREG